MTGKDEFRDFCLREWRELCERVVEMFAGKMCLTDCGVENCAVRFVIVLMKNVAKSSAVRVDEGSIPYTPTQKEQESIQPRRNYPDLCAQPDTNKKMGVRTLSPHVTDKSDQIVTDNYLICSFPFLHSMSSLRAPLASSFLITEPPKAYGRFALNTTPFSGKLA